MHVFEFLEGRIGIGLGRCWVKWGGGREGGEGRVPLVQL